MNYTGFLFISRLRIRSRVDAWNRLTVHIKGVYTIIAIIAYKKFQTSEALASSKGARVSVDTKIVPKTSGEGLLFGAVPLCQEWSPHSIPGERSTDMFTLKHHILCIYCWPSCELYFLCHNNIKGFWETFCYGDRSSQGHGWQNQGPPATCRRPCATGHVPLELLLILYHHFKWKPVKLLSAAGCKSCPKYCLVGTF